MNFYFNQYFFKAYEILSLQLESFLHVSTEIGYEFLEYITNWKIQFTILQWSLFKLLCFLLFLTLLLISYSWKTYGKVITEKFVRASTLKEIEELKLSVAKLKLPKEHSPRI